MDNGNVMAVTGAFGYSGQYIAQRLLTAGCRVRNLTNSPGRASPLREEVDTRALAFDDPERLVDALREVRVLFNTYWVRFNRAGFQHSVAVENTLRLFDAAKRAGVHRVVHVSITNPSEESPLEYFAGKARLERALIESGLSHAILRPTVLFGKQDILINNIAWVLRRFPVFGMFGDGAYRLQPVFVDDLAALAVKEASRSENIVRDAIGPETFTFRELVVKIGKTIGHPRPIVNLPPRIAACAGWIIGRVVGDVLITHEEIKGLMAGLLCTTSEPTGATRLTDWLQSNAQTLGRKYASELARRRNRTVAYDDL